MANLREYVMDRLHEDNILERAVRDLAAAKNGFARLSEDDMVTHLGRGLRMANEVIERRHTAGRAALAIVKRTRKGTNA